MPMRRILVAIVATSLLAGCGSGQAPTNPKDVAALYHQLAECYRSHGLPNYPEPVLDQKTNTWKLPDGTQPPPQSVQDACKSVADQIPDLNANSNVSNADMEKWRNWAKCMRSNGLADWPDPATDGTFTLPSRYSTGGKDLYASQLQACKKDRPAGNIKLKFEQAPTGVIPSRTS